MTETVSPATSRRMAAVGHKDTKPELVVRRIAHRLGYRFRLHVSKLPGRPDLVFPRLGTVLFVHGCFWHRHKDCRRATTPARRTDFWNAKFEATISRDEKNLQKLQASGWKVVVVWECETVDHAALEQSLKEVLNAP